MKDKITPQQAIYFAGFAFCFGLRLAHMPAIDNPFLILLWVAGNAIFSLSSWFGAGLCIGGI